MRYHSYEWDKPFKSGGMGKIYLGRHVLLNKPIIIKELILDGKEAIDQFSMEAGILYDNEEQVRHPALPAVKDYFELGGHYFLVLDYIRGESMQDFIDRGNCFSGDTVCWIADRILAGLAFLHRVGVVHRDIKPGNIILNLPKHRAVLVDFGIAKKKIAPIDSAAGKISYTRHFASPEQYRGEQCGPASDIYSLGATMYYGLTGELPPESLKLKSDSDLLSPYSLDPVNIHPQLSSVIMKAMKLNPPERFKSAGEMKEICDKIRMKYVNPNWTPPSST